MHAVESLKEPAKQFARNCQLGTVLINVCVYINVFTKTEDWCVQYSELSIDEGTYIFKNSK